MFYIHFRFFQRTLLAFLLASTGVPHGLLAAAPMVSPTGDESEAALNWQSPARLHRGLRAARGTLIFDAKGVEFRSEKRFTHRWPFVEIQTFDLSPHRFVLTSYENRGKRLPGDRQFRFDFSSGLSPEVAAELARRVAKPLRNGEPDSSRESFASIPARHSLRTGGSNGVLRFHDSGIDYVTPSKQDERSWRWSDIQTLANPDAYHFRVGAFRETFNFELKEPMSPEIFNRLWDHVYGHDLEGLSTK